MAFDTKMRSRPQRPPKHIRVSSLSLRSYHKEPYPPSPTRDLQHIPQGGLLPTPTTSSPTRSTLSSSVSSIVPRALKQSSNAEPQTGSAKPKSVASFLVPLFLYFSLNLLLTLYNKLVLVRFPFPYTLTALHALAGTFGAHLLVHSPSLALLVSQVHRRPLSLRNLPISSLIDYIHLPPVLARYTWRFRRLWRSLSSIFVGAREHRPLTLTSLAGTPTALTGPGIYRSNEDVMDPFYSSIHSGMQSHSAGSASHRQPHSERLSLAPPVVNKQTLVSQAPSRTSHLDLTPKETLVIIAFSVLYTINIVVSNMSLGLVTVPFHQVVRSSAPFFTIALSIGILGQRASKAKVVALIPVIVGVGFATYGDYYFTPWGFALTLLGTLLAALKTVITHVLQSSGKVSQSNLASVNEKHPTSVISPSRGHDGRYDLSINAPHRTVSPSSRQSSGMVSNDTIQHHHTMTLSDLLPDSPPHSPSRSATGDYGLNSVRSTETPSSSVGRLQEESPIEGTYSSDVNDSGLPPSLSFQSSSSGSSIFVAPSPSPSCRIMPSSPLAAYAYVHPPSSNPVDEGNVSETVPRIATSLSSSFHSFSPSTSQPTTLSSTLSPDTSAPLASGADDIQAQPNFTAGTQRDDEERNELQAFRFPRVLTPPPPYTPTDSVLNSISHKYSVGRPPGGDIVNQPMTLEGLNATPYSQHSRVNEGLTNGSLSAFSSFSDNDLRRNAVENTSALMVERPGFKGLLRPLSPLDLLLLTSPLAFIQCVLIAHFSGELDRVRHYSQHEMNQGKLLALLANGLIAFGLNVVSFTANKKIGALGMSVAANVKQVLTILIAVVVFELKITGMNAIGIMLTLLGGAWYASVEYREKTKKAAV